MIRSIVQHSYQNESLRPLPVSVLQKGAIAERASEEHKRLERVIAHATEKIESQFLKLEIGLLGKIVRNARMQQRRTTLFQSMERVLKECQFLMEGVSADKVLARFEKNLREMLAARERDRTFEREFALMATRNELGLCVNALRALAFGIGGPGEREKERSRVQEMIYRCGVCATAEISRSFFVPLATCVLSAVSRIRVLLFQLCADAAELHNALCAFGACLPSSSSSCVRSSAFKEELVVEWEVDCRKSSKNSQEVEDDDAGNVVKVPRVRAFASGNDIESWDEQWAPHISSSSFYSEKIARTEDIIKNYEKTDAAMKVSAAATVSIAIDNKFEELGARVDRVGSTQQHKMNNNPSSNDKSAFAKKPLIIPPATTVQLGLNFDEDIAKKLSKVTPNFKDGQGRDASGKRSLDAHMSKSEKKKRKSEEAKKKAKLTVDPLTRLKAIFEG